MIGDDSQRPRGSSSRRIRETQPDPIQREPDPGARQPGSADMGRRQRRRVETFEQLVGVTREVLFDRNLRDTSVEQITNSADVGKGTFFNYFPTKEHVVPKLLMFNSRSMLDAIARVEGGEMTVPQAMVKRLKEYFCPARGSWLTYEQNLVQTLMREELRREVAEQVVQQAAYHTQMMQIGQRQGSVRRDVPATALGYLTQHFVAGLTVTLWMKGEAPTPAIIDGVMQPLLTLLAPPQPLDPPAPIRRKTAGKARPAARRPR